MPLWLQHTLVLTFAGTCLAYALWQGFRSLFGKPGRIGNCCARGCSTPSPTEKASANRIVFLPADLLGKRR